MQNLSRFFVPRRLAAVLCVLVVFIAAILLWYSYQTPAVSVAPNQQLTSALSGSMQANLTFQQGDFCAKAQFSQRYAGDCSFVFAFPPSLEGLKVELSDGTQTLTYQGMTAELPDDSPAVSMTQLFLQGMQLLRESQELVCDKDGDVTVLSLSQQQTPVLLAQLQSSDGTLLSLSLPQEDFSVSVSS